jgi:hypothetical protein
MEQLRVAAPKGILKFVRANLNIANNGFTFDPQFVSDSSQFRWSHFYETKQLKKGGLPQGERASVPFRKVAVANDEETPPGLSNISNAQ